MLRTDPAVRGGDPTVFLGSLEDLLAVLGIRELKDCRTLGAENQNRHELDSAMRLNSHKRFQ